MPFHKYSPKTAKTLFKPTQSPLSASPQPTSQSSRAQSNERKTTSVAEALKEKFEHTRALIASVQKERYDSDLELSRLGIKEAARARIEAAQRAALDDELRNDALEELRKQELPAVIKKLEEEMRPKVQEDLLVQLRVDLRPKVHAELRAELTDQVLAELRVDLRDDVTDDLRMELQESLSEIVRDQLYNDLYPKAVADLKDEYRDMVLLQLKDELAADMAAQLLSVNGHPNDVLDPALRAESETSDVGHPPSQLAVIAKRRFSEGFGSDDADTRAKKIRTLNLDIERPAKAESLPPFGSFASHRDRNIRHIDESLDEGEKADVEDDLENQELIQEANKALEEDVKTTDEKAVLEDIHAEGDDELSQSDDEEIQEQSDQDADAEAEPEVEGARLTHDPDAKHSSQDTQSIHQSASNSLNSAGDKLSENELGQELRSSRFLRSRTITTVISKPVSRGKDSPKVRIASKQPTQIKQNDVPQNSHEWEDDESELSSLANNGAESRDEEEKIANNSETSSAHPHIRPSQDKHWSDTKPLPGSDDPQWGAVWGQNLTHYGSQDDQDKTEEESSIEGEDESQIQNEDELQDPIERYPYPHPYGSAARDDEEYVSEEEEEEYEDDDQDPALMPSQPMYSQGGRQDDPISLDSD